MSSARLSRDTTAKAALVCVFLLAAPLLIGWPTINMGGGNDSAPAGGGGTELHDDFTTGGTRSAVDSGCQDDDDCTGWNYYNGVGTADDAWQMGTNELETDIAITDEGLIVQDAGAADTYSGWLNVQSPSGNMYGGAVVRSNNDIGCFYMLRLGAGVEGELKACNTWDQCSDIDGNITAIGTPTIDDGYGVSVTGTDTGTVFTVYEWNAASPPEDPSTWSSADVVTTICASGCDETWDNDPATAKCAADTGTYVGLANNYCGSASPDCQFDDWRGGAMP